MADPAIQAAAHQHHAAIHETLYAVIAAHPDSPEVAAHKAALDAFYTDAVALLDISTLQARDGHKPPPEQPEIPPQD